MVKKFIFVLALMLSQVLLAADFGVVKFIIYDGDGKRTNVDYSPSEKVYESLTHKWFEGLIDFKNLTSSKRDDVYTVLDAYKVCSVEKLDYLLYGFVEKRDENYFANIKIYSSSLKKNVKSFYCSDDCEHYDRFIQVLAKNVLDGIEEMTGYAQEQEKIEKLRDFELKIPASLFYWTPIQPEWNKRVLGIIGIDTGLEMYPKMPVQVFDSKIVDVSIRFNLDWSFGINQVNYYSLKLNTINITTPVLVHIHYNPQHSVYGGFGFGYALDLILIKPKYDKQKFVYQNNFFAESVFGYEYNINEYINFFGELDFDIYFKKDAYVVMKPKFGVLINIDRRQ